MQQQQQQQHVDDMRKAYVRMRADSTDSIRGAFYHHDDLPSKSNYERLPIPGNQQHARRPPPSARRGRRKPGRNNNNQATPSSMADIADLAIGMEVTATPSADDEDDLELGESLRGTAALDNKPSYEDDDNDGLVGLAELRQMTSSEFVRTETYRAKPPSPRQQHERRRAFQQGGDSKVLTEDGTLPEPASGKKRSSTSDSGNRLDPIVDDSFRSDDDTDVFRLSSTSFPASSGMRADSLRYSGTLDSSMMLQDSRRLRNSADIRAALNDDAYVSESTSITTSNRPSLYGTQVLGDSPNSIGAFASGPSPQSYQGNSPILAQQRNDIAMFSAMAQSEIPDTAWNAEPIPPTLPPVKPNFDKEKPSYETPRTTQSDTWGGDDDDFSDYEEDEFSYGSESMSFYEKIVYFLDPTHWLTQDVKLNEKGIPYHDDWGGWSAAALVRHFLYDPLSPEFTSLQCFCWACIIGAVGGFYTAAWKYIIEGCVETMWNRVPRFLMDIGVFTDVGGSFPIYHYVWMCPAVFGGILSYIFARLPVQIPNQNDWIRNVHSLGVQDYRTLVPLFVLSTAGMASGLSLGPELPLVLTSGMAGSWLGMICKQSILQARVMNLTAASAAVGGFFGFPMAGALFVLEIPHRMGLQYFEALSPATIASIVAVLVNRLITGNDVTGYYKYPFLTSTLPSEIFPDALVYGLYGYLIGYVYSKGVLFLKGVVHDFLHPPHGDHGHQAASTGSESIDYVEDTAGTAGEKAPLVPRQNGTMQRQPLPLRASLFARLKSYFVCAIPDEPIRCLVSGTIAGALVGCIGMVFPHVMFWGEAQLQSMIDRGATPLPVFEFGDEPLSGMMAFAQCLVDPTDPAAVSKGYGIHCEVSIAIAKIVVTGLSLGTGIIGGHFWAPLFVGCSMAHCFTHIMKLCATSFGFGAGLAAYPCVVILCTMASVHVVVFRANMAIMLILTLTISAFNPEDDSNGSVAGDYSAVFPLLVVSSFTAFMISRDIVFYAAQRCRGDITAVPEVLCEPGLEGRPIVVGYDDGSSSLYDDDYESSGMDGGSSDPDATTGQDRAIFSASPTPSEIESNFARQLSAGKPSRLISQQSSSMDSMASSRSRAPSADLPPPSETAPSSAPTIPGLSSSRLDELLNAPIEGSGRNPTPSRNVPKSRHRRTASEPVRIAAAAGAGAPDGAGYSSIDEELDRRLGPDRMSIRVSATRELSGESSDSGPNRSRSNSLSSNRLTRINTFGEIIELQPSLMEQAQTRAASGWEATRHRRVPSLTGHRRKSSFDSVGSSGSFQRRLRQSLGPPRGGHRRKNSEPLSLHASIPPTQASPSRGSITGGRPLRPSHRGKHSEPLVGAGTLTMDEIDQSFNDIALDRLLNDNGDV